ncbi:TQO small subunit DoxD [Mucilaginibacter sp. Mucisp86]|uniref:TQO small subunit DoxD n=1 Tax=Mucilaginibacter sp. Mucisp86 TaxID=3243060 RepID=UPI0039B5843A
MHINQKLSSIYLRLAIGASYLWEVADRLGLFGPNGYPHVGWGDWKHFIAYAKQVMSFLPEGMVNPLGTIATIGEGGFGLLLILGLFTRMAAIGSGILSLCFAIAMAISFGIESPLGYSVLTLSAASFLLAGATQYPWSLDSWFASRAVNKKLANYQAQTQLKDTDVLNK